MAANQTQGLCGFCMESNLYTSTECVRCHRRLVWAFLIDGQDDEPMPMEKTNQIDEFLTPLFKKWKWLPEKAPTCRFCLEPITVNEKICPHCNQWLLMLYSPMEPGGYMMRPSADLVDPTAPEIRRLVESHRLARTS
jgi:hypothetical protein